MPVVETLLGSSVELVAWNSGSASTASTKAVSKYTASPLRVQTKHTVTAGLNVCLNLTLIVSDVGVEHFDELCGCGGLAWDSIILPAV